MTERTLSVHIELTVRRIKELAAELNDAENPAERGLIEDILKAADAAAFEQIEQANSAHDFADEIMIENPFSQWRLGEQGTEGELK